MEQIGESFALHEGAGMEAGKEAEMEADDRPGAWSTV
jgi:hypothetical protein